MKTIILSLALTFGICAAVPAFAQTGSVGQDAKDAGHDTKTAVKKGSSKTTHAIKKGYKKSTHATKTGINKSANATAKGADKLAGKTDTTK